ncbi:response regulator transcription factor [Exiguobacterium sp.]|uniref:response regulator transcription factor n=1 Tax=Exiguobacterium sp. TaxID=44751 RepID=UPI00391DD2A7
MERQTILIVEDEIEIGQLLSDYLTMEGYAVHIAQDGQEGIEAMERVHPDLVILDIMLPRISGIEVCQRIRQHSKIPIIMLSAKGEDSDKVIGLGIGADDYVSKPFSPSVLVARVKAHLRRYTTYHETTQDVLTFPGLHIDLSRHFVKVGEREVDLLPKEFQLLVCLAEHAGQVFSKEQLLDCVWGYTYCGDGNTVTVHIRRLREKVEEDSSNPKWIKTVWGVGYKFEDLKR